MPGYFKRLSLVIFIFIFSPFFLLRVKSIYAVQTFTVQRLDPGAGISQVSYNNQGFPYPSEITPLSILQSNGRYLYVLPTAWTWMCSSANSLLNNNLTLAPSECKLILKHELLNNVGGDGTPHWVNGLWNESYTPWKRIYDGMFGFHIIDTPMGKRIVGIRHGEHFNAKLGDSLYQNQIYTDFSVNPNFNVWNCWSGYKADGSYQHCWDSFAGFANLAWAPYSTINTGSDIPNFVDEGPVIWPSQPYIQADGQRSGAGLYHTSMFVDGSYIYLFTINTLPDTPGHQCMIAARSPVSDGGRAGTWKNYYNGSFGENALPAGFSKDRIRDFYRVAGGKADCIFGNTTNRNRQHIYFNVAKVKNTPYFLGAVEEYTPDPDGDGPQRALWHIRFVVSSDLIHWNPVKNCLSSGVCYEGDHWNEVGGWGYGVLAYPTFYNKDGVSNDEIDADNFYILGTRATGMISGGYTLNKLRLSFSFSQVSATPTPIPPTSTPYPTATRIPSTPTPIPCNNVPVNCGGWGSCSASCNGGTQSRTCYDQGCARAITQTQVCNTQACPTSTPVPSSTPIPPTSTPIPPTFTPIPPSPTPTPIPGDIDHNGRVNIHDYNKLIGDFGKTGSPGFTPADIDKNGKVDIYDYNILIGNFGKNQ